MMLTIPKKVDTMSSHIGPYFIEGNLNGEIHSDILNNVLPIVMEEVSFLTRTGMWMPSALITDISRNFESKLFGSMEWTRWSSKLACIFT